MVEEFLECLFSVEMKVFPLGNACISTRVILSLCPNYIPHTLSLFVVVKCLNSFGFIQGKSLVFFLYVMPFTRKVYSYKETFYLPWELTDGDVFIYRFCFACFCYYRLPSSLLVSYIAFSSSSLSFLLSFFLSFFLW